MRVSPHTGAVAIAALLATASVATAQLSETLGTRVRMEVFDPQSNQWRSQTDIRSSSATQQRSVEWRVVVSYIGTSTNVVALGSMRFQPTFSNADNTANFDGVDNLGQWRNGGEQASTIANSMLTAAEGASGSPLATYGRVTFGAPAMTAAAFNLVTTHRHGGISPVAGAPAGTWLRVAGSSVTNWPLATMPTGAQATTANLNNISRGIAAGQNSQINPITNQPNTFYVAGTQNLVVFRGSFIASESAAQRTVTLSIAAGSMLRVGGANNPDDTRFIGWHRGPLDLATWRTGFVIEDAQIRINIPTPAAPAILGLAGLLACRRRRD